MTRASLPAETRSTASTSPSWKCRQLSLPGWSISKRWWPCLREATRSPRRLSSAASATTSVVFPLFFLPMTEMVGGASWVAIRRLRGPRDPLGTELVVARVHVVEEHAGTPVRADLPLPDALRARVDEEAAGGARPRLEAGLHLRGEVHGVPGAEGLDPVRPRPLGRHRGRRHLGGAPHDAAQQIRAEKGEVARDDQRTVPLPLRGPEQRGMDPRQRAAPREEVRAGG